MIGRKAEEVLNRAVRFAFERHQEYFTLEHVLLSLLEETEILDCIQACGGSYTELKKALEEYIDKRSFRPIVAKDRLQALVRASRILKKMMTT